MKSLGDDLMLQVTLRSFWEHKRRLISTVIAIVLGVAFMAGTFVLTDTLDKVFDDLFAEGNANVDAQVQGEVLFSDPFAGGDQRAAARRGRSSTSWPPSTGSPRPSRHVITLGFGSNNRVLDPDGEPHRRVARARRRCSRAGSRAATSPPTSSPRAAGRRPTTRWPSTSPPPTTPASRSATPSPSSPSSDGNGLHARRHGPVRHRRELGRRRVGRAHPGRGAAHRRHRRARSRPCWPAPTRASARRSSPTAIAEAVPPDDVEVLTGEEAAAQLSSDVQEGFAFFQQALSIFGGIALLVGIFVISNTFSILIAQRTRELALLRAVGASRAPGARLGDARGGPRRARRRRARPGSQASLLAKGVTALLDASGADLPHHLARGQHVDRGDRACDRPRRDPDRRRDPRDPGHPGAAARRAPRRRHRPLRRVEGPHRARRSSCSSWGP